LIWVEPAAGVEETSFFFSLFEQPEARIKTNKTKTAIRLLLILFFMNSLRKYLSFFNTL
jgi:hypothetical protein